MISLMLGPLIKRWLNDMFWGLQLAGKWRHEVRPSGGITDVADFIDATALCEGKIAWGQVVLWESETPQR